MKIYGLATALSQTDEQKKINKFGLYKTTVVYDSDSKTITALHTPDKEEFGVYSKFNVRAMAESLLRTVQEVVELQNAANTQFSTDIKAPVIFGVAEDFNQGKLASVVEMIPKTKSKSSYNNQSHSIVKYAKKMSEFLQDNGVAKTSYEPFIRTAMLYNEHLDSGYSKEELEAVKPAENLSNDEIEEIAESMASKVVSMHRNYGGPTTVTSLIGIALPKKPKEGAPASEFEEKAKILSNLKALELSSENKRKFGVAFMKHCFAGGLVSQSRQPITIKTPFAKASRHFYDVVTTEIAKIAALRDASLRGTMLNDLIYVPSSVANLKS